MSIAKASFDKLAARLFISPPPTTLGESTAVLKKLQSFGHIISFTKDGPLQTHSTAPAKDSGHLGICVVFTSSAAIEKARTVGPFVVRVNHDLPDPRVEDPYNVRNLQSRKQPCPATMTCRFEFEGANPPSGQNILSTGFSPSVQTRLAQSLLDYEPPPAIAPALGVFHTDTSNLSSTAELVDHPPDLMEMYRSKPSEPERTKSASDVPEADESVNVTS